MKKLILLSSALFIFLAGVYADTVAKTENELRPNTQLSAQLPVTLPLKEVNYFETGFIIEPFDGTGSPSVSNDPVNLTLNSEGTASGSVYVYWVYATSDKVSINMSISEMKAMSDSSSDVVSDAEIDWDVSCNDEKTAKPGQPVLLVELNDGNSFTSGSCGDYLLSIKTGSVDDKLSANYEGIITLQIVSDDGTGEVV